MKPAPLLRKTAPPVRRDSSFFFSFPIYAASGYVIRRSFSINLAQEDLLARHPEIQLEIDLAMVSPVHQQVHNMVSFS
jgi:hypothetical protein